MSEEKKPMELPNDEILSKERAESKDVNARKHPDLTINRVPEKALEKFKQIAKEEYSNDYGMLLKSLVEGYEENQVMRNMETIIDAYNYIDMRLVNVEKKISVLAKDSEDKEESSHKDVVMIDEPEFEIREMVDGTKIKVPKRA